MLCLSRKLNERILIGDDIEVMVVDIDRGRVKLGIVAPNGVPIMRSELVDALLVEDAEPDDSDDSEWLKWWTKK